MHFGIGNFVKLVRRAPPMYGVMRLVDGSQGLFLVTCVRDWRHVMLDVFFTLEDATNIRKNLSSVVCQRANSWPPGTLI